MGCRSPYHFTSAQKTLFECKKDWQYYTLKDTLYGELIEQQDNGKYCGYVAFASNTIVKTVAGDTIRIIELCNLNKFGRGINVKIIPQEKPPFDIAVGYTQFDCEVKKTYYGKVIKL
ncbi:hypothetical protein [Mucilaginibacter sp. SP1R1]|uniref:hypothetical protein n=1 Tax=Mucilaginibacter sp. SP1R1 TaxID=2723091 RepID=UPI003B0054F6